MSYFAGVVFYRVGLLRQYFLLVGILHAGRSGVYGLSEGFLLLWKQDKTFTTFLISSI
jgi:hypothetical protein